MEHLLTIARKEIAPAFTLGQLLVYSSLWGCTIEDPERTVKIKHETAIPRGVYPLKTTVSPKFSSAFLWSDSLQILIEAKELSNWPHVKDFTPHRLIEIDQIQNFDLVYLHWGNTVADTSGCPIVGVRAGYVGKNRAVLQSRVFYCLWYMKVYPIVRKAELAGKPETIEIKTATGVTLS